MPCRAAAYADIATVVTRRHDFTTVSMPICHDAAGCRVGAEERACYANIARGEAA